MTDRLERLERLSRLLEDGKISKDEYEALKAEIIDARLSADGQNSPHAEETTPDPPPPKPTKRDQAPLLGEPASPTMRALTGADRGKPTASKTPPLYKVALGLGIASIFLGGLFGLLAWATVAVSGWAAYNLKSPKGRWMVWTGLALGILFSIMNLYLNGDLDGLLTSASPTSTTSTTVPEPGLAGFDYTIEEMVESWSDVVANLQFACDMSYEDEGLGKCLLPQLDDLGVSGPTLAGNNYWGQDLIPPTTFVAMTDAEGILETVIVWGFSEYENIDIVWQASLLCPAAYGYNAELPAQADDIEERCDDLFLDLLADVLESTDDYTARARKQVEGVFWSLELERAESRLGPGWSFQGTTNPATLGG